jgi:hypothetical protein
MKTIIISSEMQKTFCKSMLDEMPIDGSKTVIFKNTDMSSTAKQRRLQWLWSKEIAESGLGQDDTKEAVHIRAKLMFAHPILMRDDEVYPLLYNAFKETVKTSENYAFYIRDFASQYISTERLSRKQRAEYLREKQLYWTGKGVNLTDPSLQGLDRNLGYKPVEK